jgi:tRNA (Thr-GGU) A37 N-methylase
VLGIRGSNISVRRLDMLDGTPILDIKPYIEDKRG